MSPVLCIVKLEVYGIVVGLDTTHAVRALYNKLDAKDLNLEYIYIYIYIYIYKELNNLKQTIGLSNVVYLALTVKEMRGLQLGHWYLFEDQI